VSEGRARAPTGGRCRERHDHLHRVRLWMREQELGRDQRRHLGSEPGVYHDQPACILLFGLQLRPLRRRHAGDVEERTATAQHGALRSDAWMGTVLTTRSTSPHARWRVFGTSRSSWEKSLAPSGRRPPRTTSHPASANARARKVPRTPWAPMTSTRPRAVVSGGPGPIRRPTAIGATIARLTHASR